MQWSETRPSEAVFNNLGVIHPPSDCRTWLACAFIGTLHMTASRRLDFHQVFADNDTAPERAAGPVRPHLVSEVRVIGGLEM